MKRRFIPLLAFAGFAVWAAAFLAIYAAQNLGCRFGWGDSALAGLTAHRLLLIGIYFATLIAIGALARISWRMARDRPAEKPGFFFGLAMMGNMTAFAISAIVFAPVFFLELC